MRRTGVVLVGLLIGLLATANTGCAPTRTWLVTVRDATTRDPVTGARVQSRPVRLFVPYTTLSAHDMPFAPRLDPDAAVTAPDGSTSITAPAHSPFELIIYVPWEPPRGLTVDPSAREPSITGGWRDLVAAVDDGGGAVAALEVRVE